MRHAFTVLAIGIGFAIAVAVALIGPSHAVVGGGIVTIAASRHAPPSVPLACLTPMNKAMLCQ